MNKQELLEYLRIFASVKRNLADKIQGQENVAAAYNDVISEIGRIEAMLMIGITVTQPLKSIVDIERDVLSRH